MTKPDHDVIIVGARCAGAVLAAFLARRGARVLLLDRSAMPSEHVLSTHTIHPAGMNVLDELGVGEAVRAGAPAMTRLRFRKSPAELALDLAPHQQEYCPRRARLDGVLQRAAVEAGAELRDETRVVSLLRDGERVVGVRARRKDGVETDLRAEVVVGADGRASTVASLVSAEETIGYDGPRAMYWGYWPRPKALPREMYIGHVSGGIRVVFHTDDDRVLVGSLPSVRDALDPALGWRSDALAALRRDLACDPYTAALDLGEPDESVRGVVKSRYFLRRGAGPGWALAGDAGVHKEFVTGDGMTEAFLQARRLAGAILEGGDRALERFWRARDVEAMPWFFFGQDQGEAGPRPELEVLALDFISRAPELAARIAQTLEHTLSPYEVLGPAQALGCVARAVLRGRIGTLRDFARMGRRGSEIARAIAEARVRLGEVEGGHGDSGRMRYAS